MKTLSWRPGRWSKRPPFRVMHSPKKPRPWGQACCRKRVKVLRQIHWRLSALRVQASARNPFQSIPVGDAGGLLFTLRWRGRSSFLSRSAGRQHFQTVMFPIFAVQRRWCHLGFHQWQTTREQTMSKKSLLTSFTRSAIRKSVSACRDKWYSQVAIGEACHTPGVRGGSSA